MEKRRDGEFNRHVWPRAAVLQVIQLWRKHECLYNPRHELYHSKRGRYEALAKMANSLRKCYPEITPSEVKNKITYLRSQYSRELFRIKENRVRTDGNEYVPTVFWYSDMEFLEKFTKTGKKLRSSNPQKMEQPEDSCESAQKIECDEDLFQDCKRSRLSNYTPSSNYSVSQENPLLLPRNSTPPPKVTVSYSTTGGKHINEKDEAFCYYIKMELNEIKNKNIKDELIERIMLAVFDAKKEQKLYNKNLENRFEDV